MTEVGYDEDAFDRNVTRFADSAIGLQMEMKDEKLSRLSREAKMPRFAG